MAAMIALDISVKRNNILLYLSALMLLATVVLGEHYTKYRIGNYLYLYDSTFVILILLVFILNKTNNIYKTTAVILVIHAFYILTSLYYGRDLYLILRQAALITYFLLSSFLYINIIKNGNIKVHIKILVYISIIGAIMQFIYLFGIIIGSGISVLFEDNVYHYYTPAVIIALIVCITYMIVYKRKNIFNTILIILLFLSIVSTGHSSAVLAAFFIIALYYLHNLKIKSYLTIIIILMILVSAIILDPQFRDMNALWRLQYWKYALETIVFKKYVVFGQGYGVSYISGDYLYNLGLDKYINYKYSEAYLASFHNSFLSIWYHLGVIPMILILIPIIKKSSKYLNKNDDYYFIYYSLIGTTMWCFFNVILELPHSNLYYWYIYFLFIKYKQYAIN